MSSQAQQHEQEAARFSSEADAAHAAGEPAETVDALRARADREQSAAAGLRARAEVTRQRAGIADADAAAAGRHAAALGARIGALDQAAHSFREAAARRGWDVGSNPTPDAARRLRDASNPASRTSSLRRGSSTLAPGTTMHPENSGRGGAAHTDTDGLYAPLSTALRQSTRGIASELQQQQSHRRLGTGSGDQVPVSIGGTVPAARGQASHDTEHHGRPPRGSSGHMQGPGSGRFTQDAQSAAAAGYAGMGHEGSRATGHSNVPSTEPSRAPSQADFGRSWSAASTRTTTDHNTNNPTNSNSHYQRSDSVFRSHGAGAAAAAAGDADAAGGADVAGVSALARQEPMLSLGAWNPHGQAGGVGAGRGMGQGVGRGGAAAAEPPPLAAQLAARLDSHAAAAAGEDADEAPLPLPGLTARHGARAMGRSASARTGAHHNAAAHGGAFGLPAASAPVSRVTSRRHGKGDFDHSSSLSNVLRDMTFGAQMSGSKLSIGARSSYDKKSTDASLAQDQASEHPDGHDHEQTDSQGQGDSLVDRWLPADSEKTAMDMHALDAAIAAVQGLGHTSSSVVASGGNRISYMGSGYLHVWAQDDQATAGSSDSTSMGHMGTASGQWQGQSTLADGPCSFASLHSHLHATDDALRQLAQTANQAADAAASAQADAQRCAEALHRHQEAMAQVQNSGVGVSEGEMRAMGDREELLTVALQQAELLSDARAHEARAAAKQVRNTHTHTYPSHTHVAFAHKRARAGIVSELVWVTGRQKLAK